MSKWKITYISMILAGIILTVISFFVLPEMVITQISVGEEGVTKMPKAIAILVPAAITIGGGVFGLVVLNKESDIQERLKRKGLISSILGIILFAVFLWVN